MTLPISFVYGNLVFARRLDDVWAAFRLPCSSYAWLSSEAKRSRFAALAGALAAIESDLQLVRVSQAWDIERYLREAAAGQGSRSGARHDYVQAHCQHLRERLPHEPSLYAFVSLREPERDISSYVSRAAEQHPREWLRSLSRALRARDRRLLPSAELEALRVRADRVHARLSDYLPARPARGIELQWLVRRCFCRGLGEPPLDGLHEPRALAFECNGEALLAPLEADVVRWAESLVEHRGRLLRVESELGRSHQALLVLGALPEHANFPSERVELLFAPLETLPFPVDASLNARFLPNELALRIARRRVQDADQILRAESDGDQGVSEVGYERTLQARDLLAYLQSASRPPLLRATLSLAIGASEEDELSERVESCRRAYGEIRLHRPLGDQLALFCQHLPGQRTAVAGYDDTLTSEQVAAMMPTAAHTVGSDSGFYLGHTLSGSRRPVRFNLREGSERDRNTAILSVGALGSGKTTLAQKLQYEAFLQGARVVDCDPKGDHAFHLLEQVAPHAQTIALRPDPELRGMLDPLQVAPEHLRQEAAVSFLRDLLPARAEAAWETAVVGAVEAVLCRAREPTCLEVVRALREADGEGAQVGEALAVYARSGMTQLAFAEAGVRRALSVGEAQVSYIAIRDLPAPEPGTRRDEYTQAERVGVQMVRLIAMFAMHLLASERERLKVFVLDSVL
ncbi:MAG TPA: ATP-binding protein [Solirubrobacteraceae bacterium]|nr:ATP-binding protein [Solirubrobacteraceae bacterium]